MGRREIHEEAISAETADDLAAVYGKWAESYDNDLLNEMGYPAPAITVNIFIRSGVDNENKVLDVGCGTGIIGSLLSGRGISTIDGLDYSEAMLAQAQKKNVYKKLIQADLNKPLDIASGSYDALISVGTFTFGHVGPGALYELVRIIRSGGTVCFTVKTDAWKDQNYSEITSDLERQDKWELLEKQTIEYVKEEDSTCEVLVFKVL